MTPLGLWVQKVELGERGVGECNCPWGPERGVRGTAERAGPGPGVRTRALVTEPRAATCVVAVSPAKPPLPCPLLPPPVESGRRGGTVGGHGSEVRRI